MNLGPRAGDGCIRGDGFPTAGEQGGAGLQGQQNERGGPEAEGHGAVGGAGDEGQVGARSAGETGTFVSTPYNHAAAATIIVAALMAESAKSISDSHCFKEP